MGPCDRFEEEIYAKERKNLLLVQRRERESKRVYSGTNKEKIYSTIKVTTDCTSVFYREEEWEKENDIRLLVF